MRQPGRQPAGRNVSPTKHKSTPSARLKGTEDEARAKLDAQIVSGKELHERVQQRRFRSDAEWLDYLGEYQQWHNLTVSLLRTLFTTEERAECFENASTPLLGALGATLDQNVALHVSQMGLRLQALHQIRDDLPFF